MPKTAITPTRSENYAEWYQQVIKKADLAENSPVRGCMVIKPWGYAIWENIQKILDAQFKATGHKNFYCPLFIPMSYMEREAKHVEGFAKECAVVTHSRLQDVGDGRLEPASPLEEPLIIRPTSEAIVGEMFSRWVQSYRDLPLLLNQWATLVRWEMRTRLFLRTSEFLWQEGHTAHATATEAEQESLMILDLYGDFMEKYLAMPIIKGEKSESERFPGATSTYCLEAMMQDGKALQAGTSHFLGQNFSRGFNIKFLDADGKEQYAWTTSWGVSTRLIGGLIMTHSDDDGLVLPPKIAPLHVVIIPVTHHGGDASEIINYCDSVAKQLRAQHFHQQPIMVEVDTSDGRAGDKNWAWVKKGVPIRLEVGRREFEEESVFMGRRDLSPKERRAIPVQEFVESAADLLEDIQSQLYNRACEFRQKHTVHVNSAAEFYEFFKAKKNIGFVTAYWQEDAALEKKIKEDLNVTVRCIPMDDSGSTGDCIFTQAKAAKLAVFAKAY